ncbi:alpha-2-macroglobulin family protein [Winogradskyella ursingii]|uniref:alpha-2-macroglobulin family protein n=1 Tax=Winogradskyella ursingii TaxID=2686079 RepID=UPI0015CC62AC|nr:Ig-like domain-containing alpha-2-macroglobulin family protein [Winogradskyella ursingii]
MRINKHLVFVLLFILIYSCKKKPVETDNIFKFRDYINYTTSGLVSVVDPIKINFANSVKGWESEQELDADFIKITPHVQGKLKALNKNTLVFTPDEPLEPSTEYTITVQLNEIYNSMPEGYEDYTFQFKTITPSFNITTGNLQSYSKELQYLTARLQSADVISLEDAKKLVSAFQDENTLELVWNEAQSRSKYFEFKIDNIKRFVDNSKVEIQWDGNAINSENKGENTLTIPGKNNFTIVDTEVFQSPEQFLSINFSDPIDKQQNFAGLVTIQGVKNPKYIVDGNVLKVYPDTKLVGDIQVDVFTGIKSTDNYKLKKALSEVFLFEALKPQVRLISNGIILPNSKDLKFNFEAVNLSKVDVRIIKIYEDNVLQFLQDNNLSSNDQYSIKKVGRRIAKETITLIHDEIQNTGKWKAYSIDLSKYLNAHPGSIYRVELSFKRDYSLYDCNSIAEVTNIENDEYEEYYEEDYFAYDEISEDDEELREERYWDNLTYSYRNQNYRWRDRENPCTDSYFNYESNSVVSQNILSSDLGVIAKQGNDNTYLFAITNIITTEPERGAKVQLFNFQQQKLADGVSNSEGIVEIDVKNRAAFAIVSKAKRVSYLKLQEGNSLSLSKFDVSGNRLERGLKGYIYGERGVWRPGDSLFLTFVLNDNDNKLPKHHPVKLEITDPVGKLVYRKISIDNINNFYDFKVPTSQDYKTGNYNAKVSVGGASFSKSLKVETVKPNRLKIKIDFENKILTNNEPLQGDLKVTWLHGAPAKNLKAEVKVKFTNAYTTFDNYKDYVFSDPTRKFNSEETNVFDGSLDANGNAIMSSKLNIGKNAPGMLSAQFLVRAFENGGDFSLDAFTMPYAPYESFVGLRSPEGSRYGSFFTDENHTFNLATVNAKGQPIKRENVEIKVYKIEWRWWWNSSYDDLASYVSSNFHRPVQEFIVNTDNRGKANFKLNIPENERGRYLIRITDPVSGHATGRTAYFYKNWWQNTPSTDKEAAKMLVFSTDKENYIVGEIAKLTFPSGSEGRALVSIENGTEVLQHQWIKTKPGETTVDIPVTEKMAPNVFINISLLQPHAITANDLPIRLYGVIPMMVENPRTKLEPQLQMPDVIRPEESYEIKISEKSDKTMTYTIAVVEEGLLDLTRFKTPNAWDKFYAREALGVKTWDIFDDVIGAYSGSIDQVFAIGGDGSAAAGKNKKANRFKPVVTYLGPFLLNKGETKTHQLKMPNYIGAVRAMVVAGNNNAEAYGSAEKSVQVKKPLMVLATLPRKLSPGEKVTLPITVFAMENKVKNVNLSLKTSDGITIKGEASQTLQFNKPDEKMAYFELDVSQAKGINTVEVVAQGNGERSTYKVEIDVENPNPITSRVIDNELDANTKKTIEITTFGVAGTNSATVEYSTLPPMDFTKRLQYLIRYPHGCLEQTTSSVFPQLFLPDMFDLTSKKKQEIQNNIENGIKRLGQFQQPNGAMSYWIGENSANDWSTSYAGHFMIEAEKKGFVLPLTFKSNWIAYQKQAARNWRPSYRIYHSDLAQAYRLYTLALAGSADLASMNRLREFDEISNEAKWRLAAAYALVGQNEASEAISRTANINFSSPNSDNYTYGSVDRNRAMALETMIITGNDKAYDLAKTIAKDLSSNQWMSTQTTAYSLLAMGKMVIKNGGKDLKLNYTINGKTETIDTKNAIAQRSLLINDGNNKLVITNQRDNLVYVRVLNSGKLKLGEELAEQRGFSISTVYKDLKGNKIEVSKLKQGQDFVATVNISNLTNSKVNDVALTQIFPSGWDIVNTRFTDFGDTTVSQARYTDIKDDRVNFYFDIGPKGTYGSKTFTVMLNASYLGTYYLPGTQAEAMYNNDYLVRNRGRWITVEK